MASFAKRAKNAGIAFRILFFLLLFFELLEVSTSSDSMPFHLKIGHTNPLWLALAKKSFLRAPENCLNFCPVAMSKKFTTTDAGFPCDGSCAEPEHKYLSHGENSINCTPECENLANLPKLGPPQSHALSVHRR